MVQVDAVGSEKTGGGVEASPLTTNVLEKVGLLLGMGGFGGGLNASRFWMQHGARTQIPPWPQSVRSPD